MQATRTLRSRAALCLSALLVGLGSSCAATRADSPDAPKSGAGNAKAEEQAEKRDKLTADLEDTRVALQLAELEVAAAALEVGEELEDAQRELEEARLSLKRFQDVELPTEIADGQLGIERGMQNLDEARQELAQMEAMYAAEPNMDPTTEATRDIVLERHRKRVEFSTRGLEIARTRFQDEVGAELPKQQRDLEAELLKAERGVRKAEQAAAKGKLEGQRALAKARRAVGEAERKLAKLDSGEAGAGKGDGDEAEDGE